MSATTGIQWTDATWNPVVGCTKVSQGCKHCYAKTLHDLRHSAFLAGKKIAPQYSVPFEVVQMIPARLRIPLRWRQPKRVFVNSVSDLFHEDVSDAFIAEVFAVMAQAERHTFQILTKRPARMLNWFTEYLPEACSGERPAPTWPLPNVWLGCSVENQAAAVERIPLLLMTPAAVRFLSCEPLLGPLHLDRWLAGAFDNCDEALWDCEGCTGRGGSECGAVHLPKLDWVIVGGESGKGARPMDLAWVEQILADCDVNGVAAFVKQLGRYPVERSNGAITWPEEELRDSHGGDMAEWPERFRVREFPHQAVSA